MKPKLLKATLYVMGGLFCLAGPVLILPASWLRALSSWFAGSETVERLWPSGPMGDYIIRTSMVAYLWIGVILLVAAVNPERHRVQIDIAIGGLFLFSAVILVTGLMNGLPPMWFLGDFVSTLVAAVLLTVLRPGKA